ncbi:amino acid permease protein [Neofusicoccum parvum]|uniref:Amino acid permease protein n=1 Tax=Neofusicoccum parvum TaxID=310453 RepID=A0ACB5RR62_9PEZI|nr:amino acid permease protein [Neofusicoccum parvum]GME50772.1 amino acid permease protein [Neofusicoccum parvum]
MLLSCASHHLDSRTTAPQPLCFLQMDPSQDLSLPRTAPNTERHRATLNGQYKFAIYTIAELDQSSLHALQRDLNAAEYCHNTCALAPQPNFAGRPLRDVFDYHVRVRDEDQTIHPLFFIVATDADYTSKGVIVVHLDTGQDEQEDRVDQGRCGVDRAASWGMNIDIGNMDWEDLKEEEEEEWIRLLEHGTQRSRIAWPT